MFYLKSEIVIRMRNGVRPFPTLSKVSESKFEGGVNVPIPFF
jgi:hypothetical protein